MENFDLFMKRNMQKKNRRIMHIFLVILLVIDAVYFLLNLNYPHISGYDDTSLYFRIASADMAFGAVLLLLNKMGPATSRPYLNYVFVLYATASRLLYISDSTYTGLSVLPYVGFYLVIATGFYFSYELAVSAAATQILLGYILTDLGIDGYEIFSTMFVSTLLLLLACHMGFNSVAKYRRLAMSEHLLFEEKALLRGLLSRIDTVVVLLDMDGNVKYINKAFERITGIEVCEADYAHIGAFFNDDSLKPIIEGFYYVAGSGKSYEIEKHMIHKKDGREVYLKITMDQIILNNDSYIILAANDLTTEIHLSKVKDVVIRLNNMLSEYHSIDDYFDDILRSLVETIPYVKLGSILLTDEGDFMSMRANVGYNRHKANQFRLHLHESFYYRNCGDNLKRPVIINDLADFSMNGITEILDNAYGMYVASSLSSPIIIDGKFQGLLNLDSFENRVFKEEDLEIMQFLTEQISLVLTSHQLLNKTIQLSKFDQLTGLYNRWHLKEFENEILPHSIRYQESFYMVMMDLNNLKRVNDAYGHMIGDEYLMTFARILKMHSRETDILIRVGGDEFVGIYYTIDKNALNGKIEAINRCLNTDMQAAGVDCGCSVAFGMAAFPEESRTVYELMKIADQRMYANKTELKGMPAQNDESALA